MQMKVVEGNKIMIEKTTQDPWKDCTDFLPVDFEKLLNLCVPIQQIGISASGWFLELSEKKNTTEIKTVLVDTSIIVDVDVND